MMAFKGKVIKMNNDLGVIIPDQIAKKEKIKEGQVLQVRIRVTPVLGKIGCWLKMIVFTSLAAVFILWMAVGLAMWRETIENARFLANIAVVIAGFGLLAFQLQKPKAKSEREKQKLFKPDLKSVTILSLGSVIIFLVYIIIKDTTLDTTLLNCKNTPLMSKLLFGAGVFSLVGAIVLLLLVVFSTKMIKKQKKEKTKIKILQ